MDILQAILDFLKAYGNTIALTITWIVLLWVYLGKRSDWARKHFLDQVNFSLSLVVDGKLVMRTLLEVPARNVWLNDLGVGKVQSAAKATTPDQPFIQLEVAEDQDFIYRAILNVLSEKFADAYLAQSMGLPVISETYRFTITMERYGDIRTLKMRVLLVKEKELETVFSPNPPGGKKVEVPNALYGARLRTLMAMHDLHIKAGQPGVMKLGRVILAMRS